MDKRYQIFISSTYTDLIEERDKAMHAVLKLKCFPVGMELFPAIDRKQFDHIKSVIDECDYYILIIGARYGSMDKKGVSYTEKEYNYAVKKGIPVIAFLHSDIQSLPLGKADDDRELREKLEKFRNKVKKGRLVNFWKTADELQAKVISSLVNVFEKQPRTGWVPAEFLQKEIDKLNKEIDNKKDKIKILEGELDQLKKLKKSPPLTEKVTIPGTNVSFTMIHVDGGMFSMGANNDDIDAAPNEKPAHDVALSDYWIGETLVTQALWKEVMGKNSRLCKRDMNLPVDNVSWVDCWEFIHKLNKLTGKKFRLPTEAQWEFAARGGNFGKYNHFRYAGSDFYNKVAWFSENSEAKIHFVRELDPNELGIYDMSGNVWEWCDDMYDSNYYTYSGKINPLGPKVGSNHVIRGGSWYNNSRLCPISVRRSAAPTDKFSMLGFRLAL